MVKVLLILVCSVSLSLLRVGVLVPNFGFQWVRFARGGSTNGNIGEFKEIWNAERCELDFRHRRDEDRLKLKDKEREWGIKREKEKDEKLDDALLSLGSRIIKGEWQLARVCALGHCHASRLWQRTRWRLLCVCGLLR